MIIRNDTFNYLALLNVISPMAGGFKNLNCKIFGPLTPNPEQTYCVWPFFSWTPVTFILPGNNP